MRMSKTVGKLRRLSPIVSSSPGCAPLKAAYAEAEALQPKSWAQVEKIFLRGMEGFDGNVAAGIADTGDLQNGKGDFFNDLLALLLENCAGVKLSSRGGVPGLIIPKHNLDITYPDEGPVSFVLEAKAVGTPKHPKSPKAKPIGRDGAADLDKRVKEIAFKTIDLKAEYARLATERGEATQAMSGNLTSWLRLSPPLSYVFISARVTSDTDRDRVVQFANLAAQVSDACGVFCFTPVASDKPTTYRAVPVSQSHVELSRVLYKACEDLRRIRAGLQTPIARS